MSNFTKALRELTGFENEKESQSVLGVTVEKEAVERTPSFRYEEKASKAPEVKFEEIETREGATEITRSMVITGNIKTDDDLILMGRVAGDVVSTGNYKSYGIQVGKVKAQNLSLCDAKIKGNVEAADAVVADADTIIVGDIKCGSIKSNGKIKGNLDVEREAILLEEAKVMGNIAAESINTKPTAKIAGSIIMRAAITDFDIDFDFDMGGAN